MEQNDKWKKVANFLINKYVIAIFVFAVILLFVGEQSWVKQISRAREMRKIKAEIERVRQETELKERQLRNLDHVDSLEKFAREEYYMHADGETVYVVE